MGSISLHTRGDRLECSTRVDPPGSAHIAIPSSCSTEPRRFGRVVHVWEKHKICCRRSGHFRRHQAKSCRSSEIERARESAQQYWQARDSQFVLNLFTAYIGAQTDFYCILLPFFPKKIATYCQNPPQMSELTSKFCIFWKI